MKYIHKHQCKILYETFSFVFDWIEVYYKRFQSQMLDEEKFSRVWHMTTVGVGISRHSQKNVQQEMQSLNIKIKDFKLLKNHTNHSSVVIAQKNWNMIDWNIKKYSEINQQS